MIDAGLSRKAIFARLAAIGVAPESIDAVLISHEHSDHICGLVSVVKKLGVPVYVSRMTAPTLPWGDFTPDVRTFQAGESFQIGTIRVNSFTLPHDAVDPVGFAFETPTARLGLVTDLGYMPQSLRFHLADLDLLLLESNHDLEMLKVGPYPWPVKQRVMGRNGHLSNEVACEFILDGLDASVRSLVLGHISEHNNHPELVRLSASQALRRRAFSTRLVVAAPGEQTELFSL